MRGYVQKEAYVDDATQPFGRRYDVWFGEKEHAMYWDALDEAQSAVKFFESRMIHIDLPNGGKHLCTGFQIEERGPGQFVIFCDAPFTLLSPEREGV